MNKNENANMALTVKIDIVEEPTLWDSIADIVREAGLVREALIAIRVLEWDGPGGGNPYVAIVFAHDDHALAFLTTYCGGDIEQAEEELEAAQLDRANGTA